MDAADQQQQRQLHQQAADHARRVQEHYDARPVVDIAKRHESEIYGVRWFNNWIKSVLISASLDREGGRVLDLCCGKGGDLKKYQAANIAFYVGADIAGNSTAEAEQRYEKMPGRKFKATFFAIDCFKVDLNSLLESTVTFDLVSCQFALHYSFETEAKARMLLKNVAQRLRPGGIFIGTVTNAYWLVRKLQSVEGTTFGNSIYKVDFEQKTSFPDFGCKYNFYLRDAIDSLSEYLVSFTVLQRLAADVGLELVYRKPFHEFYAEMIEIDTYRQLFVKMGSTSIPITADEWEAIGIYTTFAFRRNNLLIHYP